MDQELNAMYVPGKKYGDGLARVANQKCVGVGRLACHGESRYVTRTHASVTFLKRVVLSRQRLSLFLLATSTIALRLRLSTERLG